MELYEQIQHNVIDGTRLKPADYILQYYLGLQATRGRMYEERRLLDGAGKEDDFGDQLHPEVALEILDLELADLETEAAALRDIDEMRRAEDRNQAS